MIQDISPKLLHNEYRPHQACEDDLFLAFQGDAILVRKDEHKLCYPSFAEFTAIYPEILPKARFLFALDDMRYFLVTHENLDSVPGWTYVSSDLFRSSQEHWRTFIGVIGWQLNRWYNDHQFCSRCGEPLLHSDKERLLFCGKCDLSVYPYIAPCVIVAVYDGNRLLLTKYANRPYRNFALIAGFAEIGESLEDTVHREVMEEVGLKVKNIRYYKSQPWPFTDTLLAGFYAELDGRDAIKLDRDELSVGVWLNREEIPSPDSDISLTGEMIESFKHLTNAVPR